jgi:hypothetical protein
MSIRSALSPLLTLSALSLATGCSSTESTPTGVSSPPPSSPAPTAAPGALQAAHEAWLAGDFIAVGERIRDVLLDPAAGELAKENALELLDKSYEAQNGKLPSRFVFPVGFEAMTLGALRGQSKFGPYRALHLYARVKDGTAARITNIQVRRLPDEVLLDKASNRGEVRVRHDMPGFEDVLLEATRLSTLPDDGVIAIRIDVDGAPVVDTWVLARHLVSSAAPEVATPLPSTTLSDGNPMVRWTPFRSPEHAAYEDRTLSVHVQDEAAKKSAWDFWTGSPGEIGSVRIGEHGNAPKTSLEPSTYWLTVTMGEERRFGPIHLARRSTAGIPFNVVR